MKDVYCDNERLEENILDAKPSESGLYPHEIVMIFHAEISRFRTTVTEFGSIFRYQLHVQHPSLLLHSLIERGYIEVCPVNKLIYYLRYEDLIKFMKSKSVKNIGRTKQNAVKIIQANYTDAEISRFFNFSYYVPTDKGKKVLDTSEAIIANPYGAWAMNCGYKNQKFIEARNIQYNKLFSLYQTLLIDKKQSVICLIDKLGIKEKLIGWVYGFQKGTKLTVIVDGNILCKDHSVDYIYLMKNIKKIALCSEDDNKDINCTCFDYYTETYMFDEKKIGNFSSAHMPGDQYDYVQMVDSADGIIINDTVNYFVSVSNVLASYILSESLKTKITMKKIDNYFEDDNSLNYKITVNTVDNHSRNIIMYMIKIQMLDVPTTKGVKLNTIMDFLRKTSSSQLRQLQMDNFMEPYSYEREIVKDIKDRYSSSWKTVFSMFTKTYPKRIFYNQPYEYYSSKNNDTVDLNWKEVTLNFDKWHDEFNRLVEDLMLKGIIHPRWINEFLLYAIVNAFFPHAIYQFHDEWLGRQSLDIYIPSLRIGIEYQGQQHYEAVEIFSGEEGFEQRKILDARKKHLCEKNNIKLIEWPFTMKVTIENFIKLFDKHSVRLALSNNDKLISYVESIEKSRNKMPSDC